MHRKKAFPGQRLIGDNLLIGFGASFRRCRRGCLAFFRSGGSVGRGLGRLLLGQGAQGNGQEQKK